MEPWLSLMTPPSDFRDGPISDAWHSALLERLLTGTQFLVAGIAYRFVDVELYHFHPRHPDPFTHRDRRQKEMGRWYFHRSGGAYRGGSFKGLDLTFGSHGSHGGILIRAIEAEDGSLIEGPSRMVDHLLRRTGQATIAALDDRIAGRPIWDTDSPLAIAAIPPTSREILRTARVGLTLKRRQRNPESARFLVRPYRYLTEPRRLRKGKPHIILGGCRAGLTALQIAAATGSPVKTVEKYLADYRLGCTESSFDDYFGKALTTGDLCRLHGLQDALCGKRANGDCECLTKKTSGKLP